MFIKKYKVVTVEDGCLLNCGQTQCADNLRNTPSRRGETWNIPNSITEGFVQLQFNKNDKSASMVLKNITYVSSYNSIEFSKQKALYRLNFLQSSFIPV